jgi:dATP pyrophosphohydrolase
MKNKSLPLIIQSVVVRKKEDAYEFLLLRRSKERGDFWNSVNGTLEPDESAMVCRERELVEEAGISKVIYWTDELIRFNFAHNGYVFSTVAYGAVVPSDTSVVINEEHTEYKWLVLNEALKLLKFKEDKDALTLLSERLKD